LQKAEPFIFSDYGDNAKYESCDDYDKQMLYCETISMNLRDLIECNRIGYDSTPDWG
jgi:hypothetical protein